MPGDLPPRNGTSNMAQTPLEAAAVNDAQIACVGKCTQRWFSSRQRELNRLDRLQLLDAVVVIAQRAQNFVIMLAEIGCGGSQVAIEAGDLAGLRDQVKFAEPGVGDG